jgi:transcriptional regulator with XRE-family HTH domain
MNEKLDQKNFVLEVLAETGWSQTDLAKRAGLDPSTLSRFLSNPDDRHLLRPNTMRRIERVVGRSHSRPAGNNFPLHHSGTEGFAEAEQVPSQGGASGVVELLVAQLSSDGHPVDAWVLKSRALELAGYRPGDTVFVRLGESALKGDVVCAQIYDWQQRRAQTVFRIFDPPFLLAATTDLELMKPHEIKSENVAIKGVVLHSLRNRATI